MDYEDPTRLRLDRRNSKRVISMDNAEKKAISQENRILAKHLLEVDRGAKRAPIVDNVRGYPLAVNNLANKRELILPSGSLPDPLISPELCNILQGLPDNVYMCDHSNLIKYSGESIETLMNAYREFNLASYIETSCDVKQLQLGVGYVGPNYNRGHNIQSVLTATFNNWKLGHYSTHKELVSPECDGSIMVLIRTDINGNILISTKLGALAAKKISTSFVSRVASVIETNANTGKMEVVRATEDIVTFLRLELDKEVLLPRQNSQLICLSVIFGVTTIIFSIAIM